MFCLLVFVCVETKEKNGNEMIPKQESKKERIEVNSKNESKMVNKLNLIKKKKLKKNELRILTF
jgi:hypothetical protein